MAMNKHDTPMLDELEKGPWPSFISGIKRLRDQHPEQRINEMANDLLGQLEHSYETRKGYWKGGTVSVFGYGGGIIPRFSEVGKQFPKSQEFHTLRVQPPAGNHYSTQMLRQLADSWEKWGSGLVTFHGQTGNIMLGRRRWATIISIRCWRCSWRNLRRNERVYAMSDQYRPIDCNLHSQYELYIMHKELLRMAWLDEAGQEHLDLLLPTDIRTELGAEYLICENNHDMATKIRLDRIVRAAPVKGA